MIQLARGRLVTQSLFNLLSWGGNALTNLVSTPIIVYYLGAEGFGTYALITGLIGYYNLLDLGLGQGVVKFVAEHLGRNEEREAVRAINSALIVQLATGLAGFAVLNIWTGSIIVMLNIQPDQAQEASLALRIGSVGFFVTMLLSTFASALLGRQRFDTVGKVNVGFSVATTVLVVAALVFGGTLVHVVTVTCIVSVVQCVLLIRLVHRQFAQFRFEFQSDWKTVRKMLGYSAYLFVMRISSFLNSYFLRFVISVFWGPLAVTYFVVPLKLVTAVQGGLGSIAGVLFPHASDLAARGELLELRRVYVKSSQYMLAASAPLFLTLAFFAPTIMTLWMGEEFAAASWLILVLLSVGHWLATLTMIPGNVVMGMGKAKVIAVFSVIAGVLSICFVFLFTREFGAYGAAAAVALSAIQGPVFVWYATARVVDVAWLPFVRDTIGIQGRPLIFFFLGGLLFGYAQFKMTVAPTVWLIAAFFLVATYLVFAVQRQVIDFRFLRAQ
jgi:O-antigen/teichoic acid export membrane protein